MIKRNSIMDPVPTTPRSDNVFKVPDYIESFMIATSLVIPSDWQCVSVTVNRCVQVRNSRNEVMYTASYEGIQDGYVFSMENLA